MEATALVLLPHGGLTVRAPPSERGRGVSCVMKQSHVRMIKRSSTVRAVMVRPQEATLALPPAPPPVRETLTGMTGTTVYKDSWFDDLAIGYLSRKLQEASGIKNGKPGYEGLIEAAVAISRIFPFEAQCEIVANALERAMPSYIVTMIKVMMPPSKFSREYFAAFTTIFFPWLVGPCEVKESEVNGEREKNVVFIPKCRFLESTNCVGMCTNLCKIPSQKFMQDSLGVSVYMSPNFEDMSCEMIFGQQPPEDDPALKQPCFRTKSDLYNAKHPLSPCTDDSGLFSTSLSNEYYLVSSTFGLSKAELFRVAQSMVEFVFADGEVKKPLRAVFECAAAERLSM